MIQKEKDLVLQDLCARLPYGVKVQYNGSSIRLMQAINIDGNEPYFKSKEVAGWLDIGSCKPYLRPMSSMTEEEKEQWLWLTNDSGWGMTERMVKECIDFLNKNMFDYRGLIPKDLAISTEDFNPYKG